MASTNCALLLANSQKYPIRVEKRNNRSFYFGALVLSVTDTQDVDLDAILGELCALESQYKDVADSSPRNSSNGECLLFDGGGVAVVHE